MTRLLAAAILLAAALPAQYSFEAPEAGEAVAELELRSPGSDWAVSGKEAAVALLTLDSKIIQHVILYGGPVTTVYRVFLGAAAAGKHVLTIERDTTYSAPGTELEVKSVQFRTVPKTSREFATMANAPILYARRNTIGRFSDIPLIVYCERTAKGLQYTAIFSNEDGGTSTRELMARWGRTTDIEYIYDLTFGNSATPDRGIVQGPGHKDVEFTGKREGAHPLLMPVTDNNMVAEAEGSPLRFQIAPLDVDLANVSRESVMDRHPVTYTVMAKELEREGKLRPFETVDGEKISSQQNYLFVDYEALHEKSKFRVSVLLKNGEGYSSDLGRFDYAIGRNGSVRTTVELPPGTTPADIRSIGFECLAAESDTRLAHHGMCRLEAINRVFFLDSNGLPGPDLFKRKVSKAVPSGRSLLLEP